MNALKPVLTRAGMRAVFNASNTGLQATISHIAFGATAYTPTGEETALASEQVRIPIAGGSWVGDFTVHMTGLLDDGPSFWIREVGIILSDGTLLAVWSHATTPLAYKTAGVPLVAAFDLTIEQLPASAITVQAGNIDLTLFFGSEFAAIATAIATHGRLIRALVDRVDALEHDKRIDWAVSQTKTNTSDITTLRAN